MLAKIYCEKILQEYTARKYIAKNILSMMRFYIKYIARKDVAILVKLRN